MKRAVCLAFIALLSPICPARSDSPAIIDSLTFSDRTALSAHQFLMNNGSHRTDTAEVGTLLLPVAGVMLRPAGWVRVRMRSAISGQVLETSLMVTLATAPRDYGKRQSFQVLFDGVEALRISEIDQGGGVARSFFLDLPAGSPWVRVEIRAGADTAAPVTVAAMRVYEKKDIPATATWKEQLGVALVSRKSSGYGMDAEELKALGSMIPKGPYLVPQAAVLYNFCKRNAAENKTEIDRLTALAEQTNIPLRIAFQMGWGGTPVGVPDGAGGTFADLPYQQITFDPEDKVDDPGLAALMGDQYDVRYGLSVPNRWSNTPWLTFNHPRLNQFRRVRLTQALMAWNDARRRLIHGGKGRLLPGQLSTGDETVYWAKGVDDLEYTKLNKGIARTRLMADFNPFVIADAQKENVRLDPKDGLDPVERFWLHRNLAMQQQRIVGWMFEALPAEPIILDPPASPDEKNVPFYAVDLTRRNIFTEPYAMPGFPLGGITPYHPGIELGYVAEGKSGGEYWQGSQMLPWLIKARERGRIALPNLECTGPNADILVTLAAAYACGARFATLYNWQTVKDITSTLAAFQSAIEHPIPVDVPENDEVETGRPAAAVLCREFIAPDGCFGANVVDVIIPKDPVQVSLKRLTPKIPVPKSSRYPAGTYRVALTEINAVGGHAVSVTSAAAKYGPEQVRFLLPGLYSLVPGRRYRITIEPMGAVIPAEEIGTGSEISLTANIALERKRSGAIAEWQDVSDFIASVRGLHEHSMQPELASKSLAFAESLFASNKPQQAYAAAVRAEQLSLPASFELPMPGGLLAPYDIEVECPLSRLSVTISSYSNSSISIAVRGSARQTVTVRWHGKETKADVAPAVPAQIFLDLGTGPQGQAREE